MNGQIIKLVRDLYIVDVDSKEYTCKCRGVFRYQKLTPLVGDYVVFDKDKLLIEKILPRKNEFSHPKVANIDQAFIVTSLITPDFSLNLLDKFIILMELQQVRPIICLSKEDLVTKDYLAKVKKILKYYESIGYIVIDNDDLSGIKKLIKDKTSVFIGQTGAGKSTLLNRLDTSLALEVGEVSLALGRGKHTTRGVFLFSVAHGKVMDTPGFSSLEFSNYSKESIRNAFIEFKKYPCQYKDCQHTKEEECAIKEAVKKQLILTSRYENYLDFIDRK